MARPSNKKELIDAAIINFEKLWQTVDQMSEQALNTEFDFSGETSKTEAHWRRDKNLRDVLVHLHEWHNLLIKWIRSNMAGETTDFLPFPYTWKTYGDMNVEFWKKHQSTKLKTAEKLLRNSHEEALELVKEFSDEALFTKKYFDWTGTTSLGSYCASALSSHYEWGFKKLKAHMKKFSRKS